MPFSQLFPADSSLPHLFFELQGLRLIADFITNDPLFQFTRDNLPAKICRDNLLVTHDPRILATSFPVKLEFKTKKKEIMGPLLSFDESNYPVVTLFVGLCYPDSSSMQDGCHIGTLIEYRSL